MSKIQKETHIVITRPDKDKIQLILEKTGMDREHLKCSICDRDITDLTKIRAIFPHHSALICCNKIECLLACRDKLIAEASV